MGGVYAPSLEVEAKGETGGLYRLCTWCGLSRYTEQRVVSVLVGEGRP